MSCQDRPVKTGSDAWMNGPSEWPSNQDWSWQEKYNVSAAMERVMECRQVCIGIGYGGTFSNYNETHLIRSPHPIWKINPNETECREFDRLATTYEYCNETRHVGNDNNERKDACSKDRTTTLNLTYLRDYGTVGQDC